MFGNIQKWILVLVIIIVSHRTVISEENSYFPRQEVSSAEAAEMLETWGHGWGYNYDSLLTDLSLWGQSPYVRIDSAGISVKGRTLWTIAVTDTSPATEPRIRIAIHARTHPSEVQSSWVTREIINLLLIEDNFSRLLLRNCVFNIMPMYNPDGVELGSARQNANGVDLERNWDKEVHEPETETLKSLYESYMISESPIRIALNMHSSSAGKRFFVCHHPNGTSEAFFEDEKNFIGKVRSYWPGGIEDWNYSVTWTDETPTHYPESWFWLNYQEGVMALTYEDIYQNGRTNGNYDKTASALLNGIADYLEIRNPALVQTVHQSPVQSPEFEILKSYPNPLTGGSRLNISLRSSANSPVSCVLYDILGREVHKNENGLLITGTNIINLQIPQLPSGKYFIRIKGTTQEEIIPMTFVR